MVMVPSLFVQEGLAIVVVAEDTEIVHPGGGVAKEIKMPGKMARNKRIFFIIFLSY